LIRSRHSGRAAFRRAAGTHGAAIATGRRGALRSQAAAASSAASVLDLGVLMFTALAILTTLTISSSLLTHLRIQYVTAGGNFYEKVHPASYFVVLALCIAMLRTGNPIEGLVRIFARSNTVLLYLVCWVFLLVQILMLERPFTAVVDTFLLPVLIALAIWQVSPSGRRMLATLVHVLILLNVAIGFYEYFVGHRIIPLTLGNVVVLGEWRSAALLGHPLTASGLVAGYVLALILRPQLCPQQWLRFPLIAICLGSLMVFGGRTALVTTLFVIAIYVAFELFRMVRGGRIPLMAVVVAIVVVFVGLAATFTVLNLGVFDKMLLRFSSDKGSALARIAMLDLLSHLDWNEILFGPTVSRANALQNLLGLSYGIENFWIACIMQFGLIHTALMTAALVAFLTMLLRQSSPAALALMLLIAVIAASSVSFSSKNIQLAQFIILITVLLPRTAPSTAPLPAGTRPIRAPVVRARAMQVGSVS
jgi:uncharacterized protein YceK